MTIKPVDDVTTKQVAAALFGEASPAHIRHVLRLISSGQLEAAKLPGKTGTYLVKPASLQTFQQKLQQRKLNKKRRQPVEETA